MKKATICIVLLMILFPVSRCFAQQKGYGERNGYDWQKFYNLAGQRYSQVDWSNKQEWIDSDAYEFKMNYLLGIYDLVSWIPSVNYRKYQDLKGKDVYVNDGHNYPYVFGTTPSQMLKALDEFYSDYRNMNIRILNAIHVCQMEITGKSKEDIEWQTRYYRADEQEQIKMAKDKYNLKD